MNSLILIEKHDYQFEDVCQLETVNPRFPVGTGFLNPVKNM